MASSDALEFAMNLKHMRWFSRSALICLALSAAAFARSEGDVFRLEQFVVEATRINRHPWRYVAVPGYEILSQCDEEQTGAVARHIANSLELDRRMMPGAWGEQTVPLTLILFDFEPPPSIAPLVPKPLQATNADGAFGSVILDGVRLDFGRGGEGRTGGVDTGDSDTHCVVQNRWNSPWNWSGGAAGRGPIPLGWLSRLDRAEPPMPAWFKYGLVGPCGLLRIRTVRDPQSGAYRGSLVAAGRWLTDADTATLVAQYKDHHILPTLPPIADLLQPEHTSTLSSLADWPSPEFMAEASLFVRWGMTPVADKNASPGDARRLNAAHQAAFARFLDRARREPATEAVFVECFGFGYTEMQSILSRYLVTTAQEPFVLNTHLTAGWSPDEPVSPIRAATANEIGRIVGDWLRMQAAAFHGARAAEREAYLEAAGRVLEHAFPRDNNISSTVRLSPPSAAESKDPAHGAASPATVVISAERIHDPRLLAVFGLYYFDRGDASSARILLEAAVRAECPRPAAYVALAQLNRDAALAKPAGSDGRFSSGQVAGILAPLSTVITRWNLDVAGYLLIADAWSHSAVKPTSAQLEVLHEGISRHPFDSSLLRATAAVYAQWSYTRQAEEIVERGLRYADQVTAEKLRSAQSQWSANDARGRSSLDR